MQIGNQVGPRMAHPMSSAERHGALHAANGLSKTALLQAKAFLQEALFLPAAVSLKACASSNHVLGFKGRCFLDAGSKIRPKQNQDVQMPESILVFGRLREQICSKQGQDVQMPESILGSGRLREQNRQRFG